jgi:transposase
VVAQCTLEVFAFEIIRAMLDLITILNHCHHHSGFVYHHARFGPDKKSIEVRLRPRAGSAAVCSGRHRPAPGYDHLPERRFEFIPLLGFLVFFLYSMRRVQCRSCGVVVVEEVPWSDGKHQLTKAYMLFLARWARKLSWKETAETFHTSWDQVCFAVEYVVGWGLDHRKLAPIRAIGVDEMHRADEENRPHVAYPSRAAAQLFQGQEAVSSGVVEGLNNKATVTMRRSYGFRTFRILELALYHSLGKLPEPELTHEFF